MPSRSTPAGESNNVVTGREARLLNASAPGVEMPLDSPSLFINRELSWLAFNARVLAQVWDPAHPLLERVKYLAIVGSNLDEFFMIRVAALMKQIRTDATASRPTA